MGALNPAKPAQKAIVIRDLIRAAAVCLPLFSTAYAADVPPAHERGLEHLDSGWYESRLPVPVLHLEGSIEDVARAHGALLARHPEARGTLDFLADALEHRLERNPTTATRPWLRSSLLWAYRHLVRNMMLDYVPSRYRDAYAEFAKAAGMSEERVWDALVLPDGVLRLLPLVYGTELAPLVPQPFGCTSIIWNSGHASVLHGRNLDYEGVGYWDRHPLILHVIPNEGLAYVAVTAMGVHAPGITAFNEAGLTLAVHQLTLSDTQSSGTPVAIISAEVIRNARSIDDAIQVIRAFPRSGGWAYVLSQGRDRAVIETSASEVAIRRSSEPFFYQTNHVASPALAAHQIFYSPGSWIDSFTRFTRLSKLVTAGGTEGFATPEKLASILGMSPVDGESSAPHRVAGGTIPKLDNIQSVMMDAAHRRLWVAMGTDRRAPNENTYVEYRWTDLRSAEPPEVTGAEVTMLPAEVLGKGGERLRELLRQAMDQHVSQPTRDGALAEYGRQFLELSKSAPAPGRWAGVYLHVWNELKSDEPRVATPKQLGKLLSELDVALRDPDLVAPPNASDVAREAVRHRAALGRLTRARLLDLLGRRSEALYEYYVVTRTAGFERLKKAADRGLKAPFREAQARALAIDWAGVDLYQY